MVQLSDNPMTWVMAGDSITQAVYHTHGARGWVEHVQERVCWQLDRLTDIVVNSGVSAWRATDVLEAYDFVIGRFAPDVLSLSLGTNDARAGLDGLAEFRDAMREIIDRSAGAQIVLHTPLVVSHAGRAPRAEMPAYCQAVRELAGETGALLVDHEAHWLAAFPDGEAIPWLDDPAHPNATGHLQLANHTLRALGLGELTEL
ncbi:MULTISPECIES: SGNH/GDSL hydrolase family protein [Kitasatospora]|uniref:GDSL-type esterase/lipase family protein n=1 Tax=Kitasatospora cathayae TaxID=3004092 RepID=A0ABY7QDN6_9ACTN|nr:GDSL-type esterase/lipase family protein [Kitasatospora sp. HUAS 3-15]WBP90656.1 GDSL-type esterase/lipase family protein [Kitasatospora sp. HUAS 3-15]